MQLSKPEQVAERALDLINYAKSQEVTIYIVINGDHQGGAYYYRNIDMRLMMSLVKQSVKDVRTNKPHEQDGVGNISYGL